MAFALDSTLGSTLNSTLEAAAAQRATSGAVCIPSVTSVGRAEMISCVGCGVNLASASVNNLTAQNQRANNTTPSDQVTETRANTYDNERHRAMTPCTDKHVGSLVSGVLNSSSATGRRHGTCLALPQPRSGPSGLKDALGYASSPCALCAAAHTVHIRSSNNRSRS